MDYSAVANDSSPWGSSSPRAGRTGFPGAPGSPQSPSLPKHLHSDSQDDKLPDPALSSSVHEEDNTAISQDEYEPEIRQGEEESPQDLDPAASNVGNIDPDHQTQPHSPHQAGSQQPRPVATRYHSSRQHRNIPQYKLQAKVTGLERTGRKDPVLRFDVHTNLPKFRTTQFRDVRRTHSEFVKLGDHLISSNPEALVPAVPPAVTSAGAGTDEDETRVKSSIQRWLNIVCSNDVLMRDEEMVFFVSSDFGYSPVVALKQPATGVRRKVLKQFAPPPDDTPELQMARPVVKAFYVATLDSAQKVDRMVRARRGLGLAESSLGEKMAQMHVQETHQGLTHAYKKLGRVIQAVGDFHAAQGTAEATTLGDPLNYHSADAFIVKESLTNRHILLRDLKQAETARVSKETAVTRLKSSTSVRREKVDEAISALDDAAGQENVLKGKTQRVTANLLLEKRKWFDRTSEDLLGSIREYAVRQIESERRLLATLESARPDIRAIDASGGLSRLGRENHPNIRRVSLASSQGAKGDAWSGVARSRETMSRSISGSFASNIPEVEEQPTNGDTQVGRPRSATGSASLTSVKEDEDDDRVDAKNAASRLAQSTF